jgi:hypothetical protein
MSSISFAPAASRSVAKTARVQPRLPSRDVLAFGHRDEELLERHEPRRLAALGSPVLQRRVKLDR